MAARGSGARLEEFAPAKINLTLRVLGRRPDGYHELESLVAFADIGDRLTLVPAPGLALTVTGPKANAAGPGEHNLVLKAARSLAERVAGLQLGQFHLEKQLPVAAGIGGGSADAAAALRLLARANGVSLNDARVKEAALTTGADVPVCLQPVARIMRGIGELLSAPFDMSPLPIVLVNSGVAVTTRDVFMALSLPSEHRQRLPEPLPTGSDGLLTLIREQPNDLEVAAIGLQPSIAETLSLLCELPSCRLGRMSGSGATCFGVFDDRAAAEEVAQMLSAMRPGWWVVPTTVGSWAHASD